MGPHCARPVGPHSHPVGPHSEQVPWLSGSVDEVLIELLENSYDVHLRKDQVVVKQGAAEYVDPNSIKR